MNGGPAENDQAAATDFDALDSLARLATDLTAYSRRFSAEDHEALLLKIYGPDRMPGSAARAQSQEGSPPPSPEPIKAEMEQALDRAQRRAE